MNRQFSAAALTKAVQDYTTRVNFGCPEDDVADAQEQAIQDYAAQLERDGEVAELVQELCDAADEILAALSECQRATGRAPSYDVVRVMQRLRGIVRVVEAAEAAA